MSHEIDAPGLQSHFGPIEHAIQKSSDQREFFLDCGVLPSCPVVSGAAGSNCFSLP